MRERAFHRHSEARAKSGLPDFAI